MKDRVNGAERRARGGGTVTCSQKAADTSTSTKPHLQVKQHTGLQRSGKPPRGQAASKPDTELGCHPRHYTASQRQKERPGGDGMETAGEERPRGKGERARPEPQKPRDGPGGRGSPGIGDGGRLTKGTEGAPL